MEPMNIWQLEEYAKLHSGYDCGRFIAITEKGIFEFQWYDAYYGLVKILQPEPPEDGFITVKQLVELFGSEQKYMPTIGYETED